MRAKQREKERKGGSATVVSKMMPCLLRAQHNMQCNTATKHNAAAQYTTKKNNKRAAYPPNVIHVTSFESTSPEHVSRLANAVCSTPSRSFFSGSKPVVSSRSMEDLLYVECFMSTLKLICHDPPRGGRFPRSSSSVSPNCSMSIL